MAKTKLEEIIENMVALKWVTSPTGKISDRAKRKYENFAKEAYERLKTKQGFSKESIVKAGLDWKDEEKAKGMALGIQEFEKKYPKYGKILHEIIAEHRTSRRAYIEFGLLPRHNLPEGFYIETIMGLGKEFTRQGAERLYEALEDFWKKLEKAKKYSILLPE